MAESIDEKCLLILKDAFKRYLLEQIGPIEDKPHMELGAWSLALIEVASVVRSHQLKLEDETLESRANSDV